MDGKLYFMGKCSRAWASIKLGISPGSMEKFVWHFLPLAPASTHPVPLAFAKGCKLLFFSWFTLLYDLKTLFQPGADMET